MNIQGMRRIDNPARIALKDMAEDRRKQNIHVMDKECNVWIITGEQLFTKESRRLNRITSYNVCYTKLLRLVNSRLVSIHIFIIL